MRHNWHIRSGSDKPGRCYASLRPCPYIGFDTEEEANQYIADEAYEEARKSGNQKIGLKKLFVSVGLIAIGLTIVQACSDSNNIERTEPTPITVTQEAQQPSIPKTIEDTKDATQYVLKDLEDFKNDFTNKYGNEIEGLKNLTNEQWLKLKEKIENTDWSKYDPRQIDWHEIGVDLKNIDLSKYNINLPDINMPSLPDNWRDSIPDLPETLGLPGVSDYNLPNLDDYLTQGNNTTYDNGDIVFQGKSLQPSTQEVQEAYSILDDLIVTEEKSGAGYNRSEMFGDNDSHLIGIVERRDVVNAEFEDSNMGSRAIHGQYSDPYTGKTIQVTKGDKNDIDLEHVVSLKEAYESHIAPEDMKSFARDMDNLVMVDSSANREKGSQDVGEWLPSYQPVHARYVIENIKIKDKYNLTVDSHEKAVMQQVLTEYMNNN